MFVDHLYCAFEEITCLWTLSIFKIKHVGFFFLIFVPDYKFCLIFDLKYILHRTFF
jgi:hypothetical protein